MKTSGNMHMEWAMKGAELRLREIQAEAKAILTAFPVLAAGHSDHHGKTSQGKRTMSAEARKRITDGMKEYWRRRKAGKS